MAPPLSLDRYFRKVSIAPADRPSGEVLEVVGLLVEIGGLQAGVGSTLEILAEDGSLIEVEVVGFRNGRLRATPLGDITGIRPGARAYRASRGAYVHVDRSLLGRVVDAFGKPMDGLPLRLPTDTVPVRSPPPNPFLRKPIEHPLATGVRAIDGFLTLAKGQRIGIFAGAGVGKSTLLGMICRSSQADANVIGLIGERGREVNEFVRNALGPEGLARSVVVAATSDQPHVVRARGAETATAIAEYLRDQGLSVLLVMDSLTRYAMALRETALASGEPPATKGYPPSVFAALPRLLERPGTCAGAGVITAIYTVLVEGDDLSDPIADASRSILDGHVVLSRDLAQRGHYPAIDVLQSISRLADMVNPPEHTRAANDLRAILATYRDAKDLIQVGAYVPGSDPRIDLARKYAPIIDDLLKQGIDECARHEDTRRRIAALAAQIAGGRA